MKKLFALLLSTLVVAGCAQSTEFSEVSSAIRDSQNMQSEVEPETSRGATTRDDSNEGVAASDVDGTYVTDSDEANEEEVVEPTKVSTPSTTTLLMTLAGNLEVEQEVGSGYDRDLFKHWSDADGDGCNARYEVLIEVVRVSTDSLHAQRRENTSQIERY